MSFRIRVKNLIPVLIDNQTENGDQRISDIVKVVSRVDELLIGIHNHILEHRVGELDLEGKEFAAEKSRDEYEEADQESEVPQIA